MQDPLIRTAEDQIIIDQSQLTMYAILAAIVVVLLILIVVALKRRKKDFIKTVPTNLKDGE